MQARGRRLWTWTLTGAATLVVFAATLSALFSFAMRVVPGYRAQLELRLQQAAKQPLQIGALALRWRGVQPVLVIDDVRMPTSAQTVPEGGTAAHLNRIELSFSPTRLLVGDYTPQDVRVHGLVLTARHHADGSWSVDGFPHHAHVDIAPALRALGTVARLQLDETHVTIDDSQRFSRALMVGIVRAELLNSGEHHRLEAQLQPPADYARLLKLEVAAEGALDRTETLDAAWTAQLEGISRLPGVADLLAEDVSLKFEALSLHASGHVHSGELVDATTEIAARRIAGMRSGQTLAEFRDLAATAQWQPQPDGWRARIDALRFSTPGEGGAARRGSTGPFELTLVRGADGGMPTLTGTGDRLQLADFAPGMALLRGLPPTMRPLQGLKGELRTFALNLTPGVDGKRRYALSGAIDGLALPGDEQRPGIEGISGQLQADSDGGEFKLASTTLKLDWPQTFDEPVPFESADVTLHWRHEGEHWLITAEPLALSLRGLSVGGRAKLELLPDNASTVDLQLKLAAADLLPVKPLLPKRMGPHSHDWLQRAIEHGRLVQGTLLMQGRLDRFPFDDPADGRWQADADIDNLQLAFSTQWPALDQARAQLHFVGRALDIELSRAMLGKVDISHAHAHIADLRESPLLIDGSTQGDVADYYAVLRDSPMKERLAGLLGNTEASGEGSADLHLEIPLHEEHPETHASGTLHLDGVKLAVHGLDKPITNARGQLSFGSNGIVAYNLTAQLEDAQLLGSIHPEPESHEGVLDVAFGVSADTSDGLFAHYVPAAIREWLDGRSDWHLRLPLSGSESGKPVLSSDLRGMNSRLPPPLRKQAADSLPLRLQITASLIRIDVADALAIALRIGSNSAGEKAGVRGVEARFGGGEPPRAEADGVVMHGTPTLVDVPAWVGFASGLHGGVDEQGVKTEVPLKLNRIDVMAQQLAISELRVPATHLVVMPSDEGYQIQLDGAGASGSVSVLRGDADRVLARFDNLHVMREPAPKAVAAQPAAPPIEDTREPPYQPARWPVADVEINHLFVGDAELGRLVFRSARIEDGQRIEHFEVRDGLLNVDGQGQWTRSAAGSVAALDVKLDGRQIGRVLQGLGYAETLSGEQGHFDAQLNWPAAPAGLVFSQAQGKVSIEVERGAVKAVEPGAGRILGLFNVYALPRRLLLNFSDVTNKGLGFDTLHGHFDLAGGNARTDDLDVAAPSVKLQVRGRIGLTARDFDEHITVTPQGVATGVTIGAALLGGPAGAIIALLAQQVLDKPLDKLTRFSYRVTGSWDNPEITHGDGTPLAPPAPAPAPTSGEVHD